jgi:hypothetical protein
MHLSFLGLYPTVGSILETHVHTLLFESEQSHRLDLVLAFAAEYFMKIDEAIARERMSRIARLVSSLLSEDAHIACTNNGAVEKVSLSSIANVIKTHVLRRVMFMDIYIYIYIIILLLIQP